MNYGRDTNRNGRNNLLRAGYGVLDTTQGWAPTPVADLVRAAVRGWEDLARTVSVSEEVAGIVGKTMSY